MAEVVCKAVKGITAGFTGETRRVGLVYDFAQDGGAYSGKVYTLANIEGTVLIEKVIVRVATIVTSDGSATIVVGNTDNADAYVDATGGALANLGAVVVVAAAATSLPSILHDGDQITMTIGTADLKAGKVVVEVWYKDVNVG